MTSPTRSDEADALSNASSDQSPISGADVPVEETTPAKPRFRPLVVLAIVAVFFVLGAAKFLTSPSDYLVLAPGPAISLPDKISGTILDDQFSTHHWSYLTVRGTRVSWFDYLRGTYLDSPATPFAYSPVSNHLALGSELSQMNQAKLTSATLAHYLVTGGVSERFLGAQVSLVQSGLGAHAAGISRGDIITSVDNRPVTSTEGLRTLIEAAGPSGRVYVRVLRHQHSRAFLVPVTKTATGYRIGVTVVPASAVDPKVALLKVSTTNVAGPSGGLMFTLAMVDALSPGDLTANMPVAGTGTIDALGNVGPIGDVALKVMAATRAHIRIFFVDPVDYPAAAAQAPASMHVVRVASVVDALVWLCGHGATDRVCAELPTIEHRLIANGGLK